MPTMSSNRVEPEQSSAADEPFASPARPASVTNIFGAIGEAIISPMLNRSTTAPLFRRSATNALPAVNGTHGVFQVDMLITHGLRGTGRISELLPDAAVRVDFENGGTHRYKLPSQHKLHVLKVSLRGGGAALLADDSGSLAAATIADTDGIRKEALHELRQHMLQAETM